MLPKVREFRLGGEKFEAMSPADRKVIQDLALDIGGLKIVRNATEDSLRIAIVTNPREYIESLGFIEKIYT